MADANKALTFHKLRPEKGLADSALTLLCRRLEAATSRLEDIAGATSTFNQPDGTRGIPPGGSIAQAASSSAPELATTAAVESLPASASVPPAIEEMDELIAQDVDKFVAASKGLDSNIADQASSLARAFKAQRQYLLVSTKAKRPDMSSPAFAELISSLQHEMGSVNDIRESNRGSQHKDQLAMIGEGVGALQWIVMDGKPADYVGEVLGGVQLYGNRVLKEHKEKDQAQVVFVQSYYAVWKALQAYIRKHYAAGVTWNNAGQELPEALRELQSEDAPKVNGAAPPAPATGGPPPPPPPPPLPSFDAAPPPPPQPAARSGGGGDMGAVFDQLNRGESVTAGLRKVDKSEMTHKNPTLRAASAVQERQGSVDSMGRSRSRGPETKPKPQSMRTKSGPVAKKEGRKELDGNKWFVENIEDASAPIEIEAALSHSILISRCKNATIRIIGKANAISIDNCSRTNVIIDSLVSSVDVVKCPNFALQVLGALPTVLLDQVDGAAVYLGKDSLHTEIYTSKCTSVNINMPPAKEDDDYREVPLPEQIRTYIKNGQLVSEIVEHAG